jgi:hypothetical protein
MDKNILSKNKNLILLPVTIFSLFFLFLIFPLNLKAQEPPICLPPGASIICENCDENYIVKFGGNNKLKNSPLYVRPDNNFIGYLTTTPFAPLHLWTESPRITFDNRDRQNQRIYTYTIGLSNLSVDQGTAFLIYDNVKEKQRLIVDKDGRIIGGGFWASGWVQADQWIRWVPLSQPPILCNEYTQGATYWKQDEGLYCCLNSQWQKCFGGGPTPPPPPQCGNGQCESGESCSSCPQDCGSCGGGGNPTGDLKVNGSDGPVSVTVGQTVTVSWSAIQNCQTTARWEQRNARDDILTGTHNASLRGGSAQDTIQEGATSFTLTCDSPFTTIDEVRVNVSSTPPPKITSFTSSCSTCHGRYTLSWRTLYADSCTLNGQNVPVNSDSWPESSPEDMCGIGNPCDSGFQCESVHAPVTYTLSCSNSAGSVSQSLTVTEVWNTCQRSGSPRQ